LGTANSIAGDNMTGGVDRRKFFFKFSKRFSMKVLNLERWKGESCSA
jgi:hypothetical protein